MDLGLVAGIEGLVGSVDSASRGKRKCNGSDGLERSEDEEDPFSGVSVTARSNKRSSSSDVPNLGLSEAMTCQQQQQLGLGLMRSDSSPQTQMLSFSSAGVDCGGLGLSYGGGDGSAKNLSYSSQRQPAAYSRNTGYYSSESVHEHGSSLTGWGVRGAFTPAQWIELEHQALVYKYLTANVPVPASLLIPIRKALCQSGFSVGSFPAYTYGWGPYHLGFSGSTDPEPGRCRRTDGKKWRCSRDAVPDQKYCERHINRGRHRSRKPVEGQTGQVASASLTTSTATATSTLLPPKPVAVVSSGGGGFSIESGSNLAVPHQQQQHIKTKLTRGVVVPPATDLKLNRMQDSTELSVALSTTMNQPKDSHFLYSNEPHAAARFQEEKSLQPEFGSVQMDALLSSKTSSSSYLMDCRNSYNNNMLGFSDHHSQVVNQSSGNPLQQLSVHDWQKDESKREMASWAEELKSDWTQLSMSTPIPLSSSSHPNNQDHGGGGTNQMGFTESGKQQQASGVNCNSITMGMGIGGPLGEVVIHSNNTAVAGGSIGGEGWDGNNNENNGNGSSPTGVLQKSALVSLSNSSSGSSPRQGDNTTDENDINNNKWRALHQQQQQQQEVGGDMAAYC